jgi:cytochrome c peroxidase
MRKYRAICSFVIASMAALPLIRPAEAQVQTIFCPAPGFGEVIVPPVPGILPFVPLTSLKTVPNPVLPKDPVTFLPGLRADLVPYIANLPAAIRLGKALFWDMQAGSDNKTACATCHFHAGADNRARNQLNPGANGRWDGRGPDVAFVAGDFPFTDPAIPKDLDNIGGSQGVLKSAFLSVSKGKELTAPLADPVFNVGGVNVRQVTGKNSPSAVNAVFNHRQFWNGRAQPEFNGVNPWGNRDSTFPRVWTLNSKGTPVQIDVRIQTASLASQAVGPVLNDVEMSAAGRTFPDVGRKLFALKPLGLQRVSSTDSVLGGVADTVAGKGLTVSYKSLIQTAFQPKWWNTNKSVTINGKTYTMMEANFSLFWGLSVMLYEATLVSDDTPMDRYLETRVFDAFQLDPVTGLPLLAVHDPTRLTPVVNRLAAEGISVTVDDILLGLDLFELPIAPIVNGVFQAPPPPKTGVGCAFCHVGATTTSATVGNLVTHPLEPGDVVLKNLGFDLRIERMFMQLPPVPPGTDTIAYDPAAYTVLVTGINGAAVQPPLLAETAVYDTGWYNIGVRPTADDPGLNGQDPFGNFLSWTRLFQALPDPGIIRVPGGGLGCPTSPPAAPATSPFAGEVLNPLTGLPLLSGPLTAAEPTDVPGTFKVPGLRNVELSGPYFHNGGKSTLLQAVELYDDGGNFDNPTLAPLIRPLGMTAAQVKALVAFMVAFTDDRVRYEKAPFDHPELVIPNGNINGSDRTLAAVGRAGSPTPLRRFLDLDPFQP